MYFIHMYSTYTQLYIYYILRPQCTASVGNIYIYIYTNGHNYDRHIYITYISYKITLYPILLLLITIFLYIYTNIYSM